MNLSNDNNGSSFKNNVIFYSTVDDKDLFRVTGFYATDINILKDLGHNVILSNSIFAFLRFCQYDLTFIYFWTKGLIPALISKFFGKKVIFTGGIDRLDKIYNKSSLDYFVKKILFKICTTISDANIIVSKGDLINIEKTGYSIHKKHYLPHVIEFEKYEYDGRPKKDVITTIVWMGQSDANVIRKGVDRLLFVYKEFLKLNNDLTVQIIGSIGKGTNYLEKIIKELGIENKITFTGRINEHAKIQYLKESKYYFQLSLYEGFGISALEALAAGNIVIHSGRGGLADTIASHGILIENIDDYLSIAMKTVEIQMKYDEYKQFILDGVQYVNKHYSYGVRKNGISQILKGLKS